jgi:hypothetical protein
MTDPGDDSVPLPIIVSSREPRTSSILPSGDVSLPKKSPRPGEPVNGVAEALGDSSVTFIRIGPGRVGESISIELSAKDLALRLTACLLGCPSLSLKIGADWKPHILGQQRSLLTISYTATHIPSFR